MICPCGLGQPYEECCGRWHAGADPPTAEALMRSRFSAFAVGDAGYLRRTWHPSTRPGKVRIDPAQRWTRLEILDRTGGGLFDATGTVEFRAHHTGGVLHETSRFVRGDAREWLYLGGQFGDDR